MKKLLFGILFLILAVWLINFVKAEIRINEVELNPPGTDNGNEWIELYSSDNVTLEKWRIESSNGRNMTFNASFSGYYILIGSYNLLTNENNSLTLRDNNGNSIFSVSSLKDSANDARSWQYCDGEWIFTEDTKNSENNCQEDEEQDEEPEINNYEDNETDDGMDEQNAGNDTEEYSREEENAESTNNANTGDAEKAPETIVLGESEDIKSFDNVVYKSKTSKIKEYALWGFGIVCIIVIILLLIDRKRNRGME